MTKDKKQDQNTNKLIDQLLAEHYRTPEDLLGQDGLLAQLTRQLVEHALAGELTHHLGYANGQPPPPPPALR